MATDAEIGAAFRDLLTRVNRLSADDAARPAGGVMPFPLLWQGCKHSVWLMMSPPKCALCGKVMG